MKIKTALQAKTIQFQQAAEELSAKLLPIGLIHDPEDGASNRQPKFEASSTDTGCMK